MDDNKGCNNLTWQATPQTPDKQCDGEKAFARRTNSDVIELLFDISIAKLHFAKQHGKCCQSTLAKEIIPQSPNHVKCSLCECPPAKIQNLKATCTTTQTCAASADRVADGAGSSSAAASSQSWASSMFGKENTRLR